MFRRIRDGLVIAVAFLAAACASVRDKELVGMNFVTAAGVSTHVESWGAGEPMLLIHGASSDMALWQPTVIPLFKDRFRMTAYDRPGMGYTLQRPAGSDTLAVQAKMAADVIDQSGLTKPIVMAHSWGGAVALRLALDYPDKIGGLVLIASVAYEWPGGVSWHLHWSANPLIGGVFNNVLTRPFIGGAVRDGMRGAFSPSPVPEGYFDKAAVDRAGRPAAMEANGQDMVGAWREVKGQQARYKEIKLPVAILAGDSDTVVSPSIHSLALASTLPNARIDVLSGVGHLPHEAAPDRLAKLVDWVKSAK